MISLIILIVIFGYSIIAYNNLTRKRNNTENAFGSIDAMLKKRFDLIPNLVATVQQYAKHEENTFTRITELRFTDHGRKKRVRPNIQYGQTKFFSGRRKLSPITGFGEFYAITKSPK